MGATRTPKSPDPLWRALLAALPAGSPARFADAQAGAATRRWAVACSGGRDSVALLHAAGSRAQELSAAGQAVEVLALHVHHGLSPHADDWSAHVRGLCEGWAAQGMPVRCVQRQVVVRCLPGESLEAEARSLRHEALHGMALSEGVCELWLAHHQRDQAETFLLQALRGAGVKGLAAMPVLQRRQGLDWVRPWLDVSTGDVAAYVARHGLVHIEDESNVDTRWARNRLRHAVWPSLRSQFGQVDTSLADAARHVADALPVLEAWLQEQLQRDGMTGHAWHLGAWAHRPANERRLLLARWYRQVCGHALSATWVARLAAEWPVLSAAQRPWQEPGLGLRLYRGVVKWCPPARAHVPGPRHQAPAEMDLRVSGPGAYPLPGWRGILLVSEAVQGGLPIGQADVAQSWQLRPRSGGERWQAHATGPARSLKKQCQSAAVPPWARLGPLVWRQDELLWVPGLGVDARHRAASGEPQWRIAFVPDSP
jgi:tRNA(Ile)-lysidine synthase